MGPEKSGPIFIMSIDSEKIEKLSDLDWEAITASELINILVKLPPMVPILAEDEDAQKIKFINFVELDDCGNAPVFVIMVSDRPKANIKFPMNYQERLARQKQIGMAMTKKIEDETKMGDLVE